MGDEEISKSFRENLVQYLEGFRSALTKSLEFYTESTNEYKSTMQNQLSQKDSYFELGELMSIHQNAKQTVITQVFSLCCTLFTPFVCF